VIGSGQRQFVIIDLLGKYLFTRNLLRQITANPNAAPYEG
jgi:hypothetical protein